MTDPRLEIRAFRSVRGVPPLERELDVLNRASRRPTPFNGSGFVQAFLDHDEFGGPGQEPWLLGAFDAGRLVGALPLRRRTSRALGRAETKIEFLVTHDNDRPTLAARPEDERRCAGAFWAHLRADRSWSVLELVNVEADSPLVPGPADAMPGVYARIEPGLPTSIIPTPYPDVAAWFRSLKKSWRHTVGRLGRRCLGAGNLELVSSADPRARRPLLELYLDLERRSWKKNHGIGRHPARVALHEALCAPGQDLRLGFQLLLLDGFAIAGMITGDFPGTYYGMETCYDAEFASLGPGNLLSVLSVRETILRGAPSLNLFADFAYYKSNWGAVSVETRTVKLFRVGSAHWLRARGGDLRRRLGLGAGASGGRFNQVKREVEDGAQGAREAERPDRAAEAALAARILDGLAAAGVEVERIAGPALEAALPFQAPKEVRAG